MSYEKTSNKDPTSYTKAADLQQLKEELELLREKRKSRRHSQLLPTLSTSIGAAVSTEVPDTDKRQPLQSPPSTTKVSEVVSSAVNIRAQSVRPELAIAHNQPPKKETPVKKKASLSSITVDTKCISSSTDIVQNLEEHSILLAKLKSSTKRTDRKTNRQSLNARGSIGLNSSEEDDLTAELLLTAFQNLSATQSTPICKSRISNADFEIKREASSILPPAISFSSSSCPSHKIERQPLWKKQSSLSKLKAAKGKVSTVINALENSKTTTVYRGHKENSRPPRPLVARYELPSPHHQQSFNIDLATTSPLRSLPLEKRQPMSNEPSRRVDYSQEKATPSSSVTTPNTRKEQTNSPVPSLPITISAQQPLLEQKQINKSIHTLPISGSTLRPLPSYTPQLSPYAGECQFNLTDILPSSEVLMDTTASTNEKTIPPSRDNKKMGKTHERPLPPKPPRHQWRVLKEEHGPNEIKSVPLHVVNINNSDDLDMAHSINVDVQSQRQQQYSSAEDDTTDSSMSDDFDEEDLTMTDPSSYPHQHKRYSDGSYFDHRYDHHITHRKRAEHQKKVSFSSVVTTIPPSNIPTDLNAHDYPRNTRGFWEAFSAEMGRQQRPGMTLLDQMDAIKSGVKYLPPSISQHYQKIISPTDDPPTPLPAPTNSKLSGIQRLLGKTRSYPQEKPETTSSSWWKSNRKTDPILDVPPLSVSPPLDHPTKNRPKKPSSFRKTSNYTKRLPVVEPMAPAATAQPQWRQRAPVSKHYHHS